MMKNLLYLIMLAVLLSSCFKEDEKVVPHDPGGLEDVQVAMGGTYAQQVYFDLASGESVFFNDKDNYDLAFESGPEGWHVLLNTASFMYAAKTGTNIFEAPIDTTGYDWRYDKSNGDLDSTAIGMYIFFDPADSSRVSHKDIYVLDRGYDINANLRGLKKIVFLEVNDSTYLFRYANLDGSDEVMATITKDPLAYFSYWSFENGGQQVYPEPLPDSYDLLFTMYTTLLFTNEGDPYPYLLTGALINRKGVETARDTIIPFNDITYENALLMDFNTDLDNIGWDWKVLEGDVTGGGTLVYNIVEGLHFVIRDTDGYLYKLRFTGFYNNEGVKGYPRFEYQRL